MVNGGSEGENRPEDNSMRGSKNRELGSDRREVNDSETLRDDPAAVCCLHQ